MSEIYRNTTQFVTLDIYGGTADALPVAIVPLDTPVELTVNGPETVGEAERWTTELPLSQTQENGEVEVVWTFVVDGQPATKTDVFNVVTPLVSLADIKTELELDEDVTDTQLIMAERRVRKIIEAHCGQKFHAQVETLTVNGQGDRYLRLPKRLVTASDVIDSRNAISWVGYVIAHGGWSLKRTTGYYYDVVTTVAPIYAPYQYGGKYATWPRDITWDITGTWGWSRVPDAVSEAALVLLEQRLCGQAAYRDSYLSSMKASDWRFDYFQEAIQGTGNVVADQLLENFVVVGTAVV